MTTYIQIEDYKIAITSELLDIVTEADADTLEYADKMATDMIAGYLGAKYDLQGEFAKTAKDRNYQILFWSVTIALYIIFQRIGDSKVPDKIIKNYDDTIKTIEEIGKGKIPVNLELKKTADELTGTDQLNNFRRIGSEPKRSHHV